MTQPIARLLDQVVKDVTGESLMPTVFGGTADARYFGPTEQVAFFGPVGGNLHAPDEYLDLASFVSVDRILALLIRRVVRLEAWRTLGCMVVSRSSPGASRGLGQAIACDLASAGTAVALTARNVASLSATVRELDAPGARTLPAAAQS